MRKASGARLAALTSYVADLQARMGLVQWHVIIHEHKLHGLIARVDPTEGRYYTYLSVARPTFWNLDPEWQRNAIVHELTHLVQLPATDIMDHGKWKEDLALPVWRDVLSSWTRGIELMTDHLTTIIAPSMPLPPKWPK
jgi:hypothetical protein